MIHWQNLTTEERRNFGDGCGIHPYFSVPNLIWCEVCRHHDFRRNRGTGWAWNQHPFLPYSLLRWWLQGAILTALTDVLFLYFMLKETVTYWRKPFELFPYLLLSIIYFIVVFIVGQIPSFSRWNKYRTKIEIFAIDAKLKKRISDYEQNEL